ncbi:MAG: response regulator transcription factor [Phycisphaerales bacterium JB052]
MSTDQSTGYGDDMMGDDTGGMLDEVRVLIVDDEKDILDSIEAAFQSEGALTLTAMDGDEAVRICDQDPPDIVILDMMLPKRSGFLALEKIKGKEDSPIVIMVTANEGKRHQAYGESLGVDAYMQKPVPLGLLLNKAADLLDARDEADGLLDD